MWLVWFFVFGLANGFGEVPKPGMPVAEVVLTPSQQWKTAREEEIRFRERLKRFIRKQFQIEKAEMDAKRMRRQASSLETLSSAGLTQIPVAESPMAFNPPPTTALRFQQRRSSLGSTLDPSAPLTALQDMMSQAINVFGSLQNRKLNSNMEGQTVLPEGSKAGALLDAFQSPQAKAISQSLTNAVLSGKLPVASLMQVASALSPELAQAKASPSPIMPTVPPMTENSVNSVQQNQDNASAIHQMLPAVNEEERPEPVIPPGAVGHTDAPSQLDTLKHNGLPNNVKDDFWNHAFNSNGPIDMN